MKEVLERKTSIDRSTLPEDFNESGKLTEVAPDVFRLKIKLPMGLDHVNIWFLKDNDKWVIVDTGINSSSVIAIMKDAIDSFCGGKISKVFVTHFHPDHIGLAGWIEENYQAELYMSEQEWLLASLLFRDTNNTFSKNYLRVLQRNGFDQEALNEFSQNHPRLITYPVPLSINELRHNQKIVLNNSVWEVFLCGGHSPAHVCLYCKEKKLLISGDQIMPDITTSLSFLVYKPMANPLKDYFDSLLLLEALESDLLILPSHGAPFYGFHKRIKEVREIFHKNLQILVETLVSPYCMPDLIRKFYPQELNMYQKRFVNEKYFAYLTFLKEDGRISSFIKNDIFYYQKI